MWRKTLVALFCVVAPAPASAQSTITPPSGYKVITLPFTTTILSFTQDGTIDCWPKIVVKDVEGALYYQIDYYRWFTQLGGFWAWEKNTHVPHPLDQLDKQDSLRGSGTVYVYAPYGDHWIAMPSRGQAPLSLNCDTWVAYNYGERMARAVVPESALELAVTLPNVEGTLVEVGKEFEVLVSIEALSDNGGPVSNITWDALLVAAPDGMVELVSGPDPAEVPENFSLAPGESVERSYVLRGLSPGTVQLSTDATGTSAMGFAVNEAVTLDVDLHLDLLDIQVEVEETLIELEGTEEEPLPREVEASVRITNVFDEPIELVTLDNFDPISLLIPPPHYGALTVKAGPFDPAGPNADPLSIGTIQPGQTVRRNYTLEASNDGEYEILAVVSGKHPGSGQGFTEHGTTEVEIDAPDDVTLEAEREAPNDGFKTELTDVFAGETIRYKGTGWDPEGGEITIAFGGRAVTTIPAAAEFEAEFELERFPQLNRADEIAGKAICAGKLQAFQGASKAAVSIFGRRAEEPWGGGSIVNGLGDPFKRFDFICAGEFAYPADGLPEVPFVGADELNRIKYDNEGKPKAQLHSTYICEAAGLTAPHLLITLPDQHGGRTLPDRKSLGGYSGAWVQYRSFQGKCIDVEGVNAAKIFLDGILVYQGPSLSGAGNHTHYPPIFGRPLEVGQVTLVAKNYSIVSSAPDPKDLDGDGIENDVDVATPSGLPETRHVRGTSGTNEEFSDEFAHPEAPISGVILERNTHTIQVGIDPDHPESLRIKGVGFGAGTPADVVVCGIKIRVRTGDTVRVSCAPFQLEVIEGGPIKFFAGAEIGVEVHSRNGATVSEESPGIFEISALASNVGTIRVIELPSTSTLLNPGNSILPGTESDADFDGIADSEDACPLDYRKTAPGICGCGGLDADSDADGLIDCRDGCPFHASSEPCDCGNGVVDEGEACDTGPFTSGRRCSDACTPVPCGQPTKPYGGGPTAADAQFALRAAVGIVVCDVEVCDVNANGSVASGDALLILRKSVGQPAVLGCAGG